MATGTLSPDPYLTVINASGVPYVGAKVFTYLAGTTTPVATYTDVGLTVANTNPIITDAAGRYVVYLSPGASYKYVIQDSTGAAIKTIDNISAVPGSSSSLDITGTAGETLTAGQAVYLSDGSGGKTAGQWFKADNTNGYSSIINDVGMVPATIATGQSGTIRKAGTVPGLSGLTIGALYYIGTAGAITSTPPATNVRLIGQADTTGSLVVAPSEVNAPGTATTFLRGDGVYRAFTTANLPLAAVVTTSLETAGRFATGGQINGGGSNAFGTTGAQILTSATGTSSSGFKWQLNEANDNLFSNSPRISMRIGLTVKGSDAQVFIGLGPITVSGTALTFTDSHVGFKITWSGSGAASLFATQADGTETASSALTTVVAGDALELAAQINSTTSVDYYWRKNGGVWSAATNLSTHVPTAAVQQMHAAICNSAVASASTVTVTSFSYQR